MSGQMSSLTRTHRWQPPTTATVDQLGPCAQCGRGSLAPIHQDGSTAERARLDSVEDLVGNLHVQLAMLAANATDPGFKRGLAWGIEALLVTTEALGGETRPEKLTMRQLAA